MFDTNNPSIKSKGTSSVLLALCIASAALSCSFESSAQSSVQSAPPPFVTIKNSEIHYVEKENGIRSAVIFGDPDKPGYYITRNIFPPGVMSTPHSHDQDRFVTVIRGTWYAGTNAKWDTSETIAMPAGSTMFHPKGAVHYDGSLVEETEVQIIGMGPVKTDYIHKDLGKYGKPHKMTP